MDARQDGPGRSAGAGALLAGRARRPARQAARHPAKNARPRRPGSTPSSTRYRATIGPALAFLQGRDPPRASHRRPRPAARGPRFAVARRTSTDGDGGDPLAWAFGALGVRDKARHLATLYLNDLADVLRGPPTRASSSCATPNRWRWPSHLRPGPPGRAAQRWWTTPCAASRWNPSPATSPQVVLLSVPFPGSVYAAFRIAQTIKARPAIVTVLGGGFVNTELRGSPSRACSTTSTSSRSTTASAPAAGAARAPGRPARQSRAWCAPTCAGRRRWCAITSPSPTSLRRGRHAHLGRPAAGRLPVDPRHAQPMHRLWSDGRWNKLTVARLLLEEVQLLRREPRLHRPLRRRRRQAAGRRIEAVVAETGQTGFHFVDRPPAQDAEAMADELARRGAASAGGATSASKSFTPSCAASSPTAAASPSPAGWKSPPTACSR